jgi:hypothetical protein
MGSLLPFAAPSAKDSSAGQAEVRDKLLAAVLVRPDLVNKV